MEDQNIPVIPEQTTRFRFLGKVKENPIIAIFILFAFLGSGALLASQTSFNPSSQDKKETPKDSNEFISNHSIVYGFWADNKSVISVADLSTNTTAELTRLPINVKHVKIIDSDSIAYISETDDRDYGKKIVVKTISSGAERTVFEAQDKFGIDDYVLSPGKKYAAVWVVQPSSGGALLGGSSRVYAIEIGRTQNLIYNEAANPGTPVNYPIAITDSGEVFTDKFLPNSGAGWGYGMSVSNFSGTTKEAIPSMANGTISTQPIVSPDGKKLVFAGYDGSKGLGAEEIRGFRRAISIPNTIESFDLTSKRRIAYIRAQNEDFFPNVEWELGRNNVIYGVMSRNKDKIGQYIYDVSSGSSRDVNNSKGRAVAILDNNKLLLLDESLAESNLGNLGGRYNQILEGIYISSLGAVEKKIRVDEAFIQIMDILEQNYFINLKNQSTANKKQLQLYSFSLKPSLAPKREEQSSPISRPSEPTKPRCKHIVLEQCNAQVGTNLTISDIQFTDEERETVFGKCFFPLLKQKNDMAGRFPHNSECLRSPLYLYGYEGKNVKVDIGTSIYGTNTAHSPSMGFSVTLGKGGGFTANGKKISSLEFDYTPAVKVTKPSSGYLVSKSEVEESVRKIAAGLGLNEKETSDTLASIKSKVVSPYVFISWYDDNTSKEILPILFSPEPDNYRNIVFYIENLDQKPNASYGPPVLEKIVRGGFTAIEISFIVK